MTTVISPGNNEASVRTLKRRHRWLVLRAASIGVDPEVAAQNLRRSQRLAFTINRREDLSANVITGANCTVVLVLIVRTTLTITPSNDELIISEIRH